MILKRFLNDNTRKSFKRFFNDVIKNFLGLKACNFIKKRLQYRFHSDDTKKFKKVP